MSLIPVREDPTGLRFEPGTELVCNSCRRQYTVGPDGQAADFVNMSGKGKDRISTPCPSGCGGYLQRDYEPPVDQAVKATLSPSVFLGAFFGVPLILVGIFFALVQAPKMNIERLSPTFIQMWEPIMIFPPNMWSFTTVIFGIVLFVIGCSLIGIPLAISGHKPSEK